MCSRRARNRACEFRDQALCAIKARNGRESAPQTAHSTAFSVILILPAAGWSSKDFFSFAKRPPVQPDGKGGSTADESASGSISQHGRTGGRREAQDGGDACESNAPETFCAPHDGFEGRGAHQDPSISAWSERTRARCRFMIAHNRAEHLHFPEEREKPRRGVQGAPKAEAVQTALSNSPRARRPNAAGRRLPAHAARPRAWAGNPPCGGRERSA